MSNYILVLYIQSLHYLQSNFLINNYQHRFLLHFQWLLKFVHNYHIFYMNKQGVIYFQYFQYRNLLMNYYYNIFYNIYDLFHLIYNHIYIQHIDMILFYLYK